MNLPSIVLRFILRLNKFSKSFVGIVQGVHMIDVLRVEKPKIYSCNNSRNGFRRKNPLT